MKKLYVYAMVIACLLCTASIHAQDRFWILTSGTPGNWNDATNWSSTAGGSGGFSVPNGAGFNAFFTAGATVNVNVAAITLGRLTVSGVTPARLIANTGSVITVQSGAVGTEGVRINAGATLESGVSGAFAFSITFANGARGLVDGTWLFTGQPGVNPPNGATFTLPGATGQGNRLDINNGGTLRFNSNTRIPTPGAAVGAAYIFFNSGSTYQLDRDAGATLPANWNANSTIRLTGIVGNAPVINLGSTPNFGHLVVDCPNMNNINGPTVELGLTNNMVFQGNVQVLNTNNFPFVLEVGVTDPVNVTVNGNFNVSGTSVVYIGDDNGRSMRLGVAGSMNLTGGSFLMQFADGVGTNSTTLALGGNLTHTGGTFGVTSNSTSTTNDLFVLEMNGAGVQSINSTVGVIDNANNMLTLRLNNAAGVSLAAPLAVGKISWNSASKGLLTTTATNFLTIRNGEATNATVVNAPANNGYVSGPVRRLTNSTGVYLFPTGKNGFLRYSEVVPTATTASTFTSEYFRAGYPTLAVMNPLTGVSTNEYWEISRQSGSTAAVQLNLAGALPGTGAGDAVTVARFSGTHWVSVKGAVGTVITPGNAASGTSRSDEITTFSPFTLAYGPAGALPIDLVSFSARKIGSSAAQLNWVVTSSSTPDRFEVLRSTDGSNFSSIATVQGVDQQTNYSYTDNNLPAATTYYRLRMIDKDGDVKLSKVVVISNGSDGIFLTGMMPTIVTDRARVGVTSSQRGSLQLVITDMYGRIVKQQINGIEQGSQEIWLNLHALPGGAYQITGYVDGKRSASIRFIKQ